MYGGNRGGCHGGGRGGPGGGWGGPGGGRGGPGGGWGGPGGGRGGPGGGCGGRGGPGGGPGGGRGGPWGGPWGGPGCGPRGGRGGPWGGPGGGPWGGPGGGPWNGPGGGPWNGPGGGPWNGPGGHDGCTTTPPSTTPPTTPLPTPPAPTPPPPTPPAPTPVKKLEAQGGETGAVWDDGHHDDVKKVYVGQGIDGISAVKFEYIKGSQVVFGDEHGQPTGLGYEEFELEAGEYITSVEGTYDKIYGHDSAILTMLLFKTNLNKTKGPFGMETQSRFEFKEEGYKITGFHGRAAGDVVHAIGAYFAPIGTTPLKPATPA